MNKKQKLRLIITVILVLLFIGLLIDAFSGFYILRYSKTIYGGIVGMLLLGALYLFGEAGTKWIDSKDDVFHPLYKRVFHLALLLLFIGVIMVISWAVFKFLADKI